MFKGKYRDFDYRLFCILFIFILWSMTAHAYNKADKFLVLHLDGVSSEDFFKELEANNLPNIAKLFAKGQQIKHGLTLYPGGTEIIVPRLKQGLDNSQGNIVGWGYIQQETGKVFTDIPIFLQMFAGFDRRNRHQFLLGLPLLTHIAGASLLNIERLWETQDVVEFYWFHSDTVGHLCGTKAHLNSVRSFDYYLGLVADTGKLKDANLVLYCDHGMTTKGVEAVKHGQVIKDMIGVELHFFAHPNIYLKSPEKKREIAEQLGKNPIFDIALIKASDNIVQGFTAQGHFEIKYIGSKYEYSFTGEDFFGYSEDRLDDVFLSKDEWLRQTKNHVYPAAPPNIFGYLNNPVVGDIVIALKDLLIPYGISCKKGNHANLKHNDLLVPVLFTGPAFADLEPLEEIWLNELFTRHLTMIDFTVRQREKNSIRFAFPAETELIFSPFYRLRGGLLISDSMLQPWLEYDLYSSFLTRIWLGLIYADQKLNWQLKVEGFLGNLGLTWRKQGGTNGKIRFDIRLSEHIELNIAKHKAGITFSF